MALIMVLDLNFIIEVVTTPITSPQIQPFSRGSDISGLMVG